MEKKIEEKEIKKEEKKNKDSFFQEVKLELKKVTWPSLKLVVKYTIATLVLCVIFVIFFILINLLSSAIKGMFI